MTKHIVFLNTKARFSDKWQVEFFFDYYGEAKFSKRAAIEYAQLRAITNGGAMELPTAEAKVFDTVTPRKIKAIVAACYEFGLSKKHGGKWGGDNAPVEARAIWKALSRIVTALGLWGLVNDYKN